MAVGHFVVGSIISTFSLVCYLWLCISIFKDYTHCRYVFDPITAGDDGNQTMDAMTVCRLSIQEQYADAGCSCRSSMDSGSDQAVRIFNDTAVAFASLLFIALLAIEVFRLSVIFCISWPTDDERSMMINDFTINSFWGLLGMMTNENLISHIKERDAELIFSDNRWIILYYLFALIIVFVYENSSNRYKFNSSIIFLSLISIGLSIFQLMIDYRRMNNRIYMNARRQENSEPPTIHMSTPSPSAPQANSTPAISISSQRVSTPSPLPTAPPPAYEEAK